VKTHPVRDKSQGASTIPQLLLKGFPDGTIKIGPFLSILKKKDGTRTYFIGADKYFSHPAGDADPIPAKNS
jgi:hypothetical protein